MSLRYLMIWSSVGIVVILPAFALVRWRVISARKLADRIISELKAKGEQTSGYNRKALAAQLLLSGWKTRLLTLRIQGVTIPDIYLQEWACIERRIKRVKLVWIILGVVFLVVLKSLIQSE